MEGLEQVDKEIEIVKREIKDLKKHLAEKNDCLDSLKRTRDRLKGTPKIRWFSSGSKSENIRRVTPTNMRAILQSNNGKRQILFSHLERFDTRRFLFAKNHNFHIRLSDLHTAGETEMQTFHFSPPSMKHRQQTMDDMKPKLEVSSQRSTLHLRQKYAFSKQLSPTNEKKLFRPPLKNPKRASLSLSPKQQQPVFGASLSLSPKSSGGRRKILRIGRRKGEKNQGVSVSPPPHSSPIETLHDTSSRSSNSLEQAPDLSPPVSPSLQLTKAATVSEENLPTSTFSPTFGVKKPSFALAPVGIAPSSPSNPNGNSPRLITTNISPLSKLRNVSPKATTISSPVRTLASSTGNHTPTHGNAFVDSPPYLSLALSQGLSNASPSLQATSNKAIIRFSSEDTEKKLVKPFVCLSPRKRQVFRPRSSSSEKDRITSSEIINHWDHRFRTCLERVRGSVGVQERISANTEMMHLSQDFVYAARVVGKLLISEVYLPLEEKLIKPVKGLGGRAGGEKFMVHNIFFKFAVDAFGLFNGSDLSASKVSGHELKGLMAYFSLGLKQIHFPLMSLVDYRGFRVIAISLLPLSSGSLIYGTNDAGMTVKNEDPNFNRKMKSAARALNLASHICGLKETKELASAADIEGHKGTDGKYYLLDFSRTMPPVAPDLKKYYNGHLYQLFRREFVVKFPKPLCSDGFSGFTLNDPNKESYNKDLREASERLLNSTIPECAQNLCEVCLRSPIREDLEWLVRYLHRNGINLRYIGHIISSLEQCHVPSDSSVLPSDFKESILRLIRLLLTEATARVMKNELNEKWRNAVKDLKLPQEVLFRKLAIDYLNSVFGVSTEQEEWWNSSLLSKLSHNFGLRSLPSSISDLRESIFSPESGGSLKAVLLKRVTEFTGLVISKKGQQNLLADSENPDPLGLIDLLEIQDRVKSMDIVNLSLGNFFLFSSLTEKDSQAEMGMLQQAIEKYEEALNSNANRETLLNCSAAYYRLLLLKFHKIETQIETQEPPQHPKLAGFYFDKSDEDVQRAALHMRFSVEASQGDSANLCLYAMFLERTEKFQEAEGWFMRAIELNPKETVCSVKYMSFLDSCGMKAEADRMESLAGRFMNSVPIDPLTSQPMKLNIDVYSNGGSKTSVVVLPTMMAIDVISSAASSLQISLADEDISCQLWLMRGEWNEFGSGKGVEGSNFSFGEEQIFLDAKGELFQLFSFLWFRFTRNQRKGFCYLRVCPSPFARRNLRPLLVKDFPKTPPITSTSRFLLDIQTATDTFLLGLLFIRPLIASKDTLLSFLVQNLMASEYELHSFVILKTWLLEYGLFQDLKELEVIETCESIAAEKKYSQEPVKQRMEELKGRLEETQNHFNAEVAAVDDFMESFVNTWKKRESSPTTSSTSLVGTSNLTTISSSSLVATDSGGLSDDQHRVSSSLEREVSFFRDYGDLGTSLEGYAETADILKKLDSKKRVKRKRKKRNISGGESGGDDDGEEKIMRSSGYVLQNPGNSLPKLDADHLRKRTEVNRRSSAPIKPRHRRETEIFKRNKEKKKRKSPKVGWTFGEKSPKSPFLEEKSQKIFCLSESQIEEIALTLRAYAFALHMRVLPRDYLVFLLFCDMTFLSGALADVLEYEKAISDWVVQEISKQNEESLDFSMRTFFLFTCLAKESFKIGDLGTCTSIMKGLESQVVKEFSVKWCEIDQYLSLRNSWQQSLPFLLLMREGPSASDMWSDYQRCFKKFRGKAKPFVGSMERTVKFLSYMGPLLHHSQTSSCLHLKTRRCSAIFSFLSQFEFSGLCRGTGKILPLLTFSSEKVVLDYIFDGAFQNLDLSLKVFGGSSSSKTLLQQMIGDGGKIDSQKRQSFFSPASFLRRSMKQTSKDV